MGKPVFPVTDEVLRARDNYTKIQAEFHRGIRESTKLDGLRANQKELELELNEKFRDGGVIENSLRLGGRTYPVSTVDFCVWRFNRYSGGMRCDAYGAESLFDFFPVVDAFRRQIGGAKGQKILEVIDTHDEGSYAALGTISGPLSFEFKESFTKDIPHSRHEYIPISEGVKIDPEKGEWVEMDRDDRIDGEEAIFYSNLSSVVVPRTDDEMEDALRGKWIANYPQGKPEGFTEESCAIYVGNDAVEARCEKGFDIAIPSRKSRVVEMPWAS